MDAMARVTSKGQITIPKVARDALGLHEGDTVLFRVVGAHALIARTPNLLELAGTVRVPEEAKGLAWSVIRDRMRERRYGKRT